MATLESLPSITHDDRKESYDEKKAVDKESVSSDAASAPVDVWDDGVEGKERPIGSSFSLFYLLAF